MVDTERLVAVLGRITSRLRILDEYARCDRAALRDDRVRLGDLKYTFQTAIEACIDAAQHVVADQGLGVPASNAAAFRSLADADVVDEELAIRLAGAVRFRNVLVHGYAEVDDLDALERFVAAMTALLA